MGTATGPGRGRCAVSRLGILQRPSSTEASPPVWPLRRLGKMGKVEARAGAVASLAWRSREALRVGRGLRNAPRRAWGRPGRPQQGWSTFHRPWGNARPNTCMHRSSAAGLKSLAIVRRGGDVPQAGWPPRCGLAHDGQQQASACHDERVGHPRQVLGRLPRSGRTYDECSRPAARVGVPPYVNQIERGKKSPTPDAPFLLRGAPGISATELVERVEGSGNRKPRPRRTGCRWRVCGGHSRDSGPPRSKVWQICQTSSPEVIPNRPLLLRSSRVGRRPRHAPLPCEAGVARVAPDMPRGNTLKYGPQRDLLGLVALVA